MASRAKKTKLDLETRNFNDDITLKYPIYLYYEPCMIRNQCVCSETNVFRKKYSLIMGDEGSQELCKLG